MSNIVDLMRDYGRSHTKKSTQLTHFVGVPAIYFALFIILGWVDVPLIGISFSWFFTLTLIAYYLFLDLRLGLVSLLIFFPMVYFAQLLGGNHFNWDAFYSFLFLFTFGWLAQLVGHYWEGKRPAFLSNLFQVFIAPLFLVGELLFMFGYCQKLQAKVRQGIKK